MSNDITFCVSKDCQRDCWRKNHPMNMDRVSFADLSQELLLKENGEPDYDKCEYFLPTFRVSKDFKPMDWDDIGNFERKE